MKQRILALLTITLAIASIASLATLTADADENAPAPEVTAERVEETPNEAEPEIVPSDEDDATLQPLEDVTPEAIEMFELVECAYRCNGNWLSDFCFPNCSCCASITCPNGSTPQQTQCLNE